MGRDSPCLEKVLFIFAGRLSDGNSAAVYLEEGKVMSIKKCPIVVIGMARSGTTLASHLLGCSPEVYSEIEPHVLWKCGSFRY